MSRAFRHALITGAAGAIGGALAEQLRRAWPDLALTLVDKDAAGASRVAKVRGGNATGLGWDLARVDALEAAWQAMLEQRGDVDLLVNCAGFMEIISLVGTPWPLGQALLDVDLVAPLRLMQLAAPAMIAARAGAIVNVSSMAGRVPLKGCTFYGAAKAGIGTASEIARLELAPHGVQVVTVYPGPIQSGLEAHARGQVRDGVVRRGIPTGKPAAIAAHIVRALKRGEPRVVHPPFYAAANRVLPLAEWISARFGPDPLK